MLILTRKSGEVIRIGDLIQVKVLGIKGYQVRIGIDAPRDVEVHRDEIYNRIQRERGLSPGDDNAERKHQDGEEEADDRG